jgi:hypothetical protein
MMTIILRIVHVAFASVWVGYPLGASGDIRRTLALGPPHTDVLVSRINRTARITIASGVLTAATGLGLVFAVGGFGAVTVRIHIGLTLTLLSLAVGGTLTHPAWFRIREAIAKGDLEVAKKNVKRFAAGDGIEQLLKFTVLALMLWKA